ncbi:MAG TPA: inositol monophosphatase family protein [Gemmatimonadales bacterium]|jgi:myo-inositol-1(or 4)-monophosphatase
MPEKTRAIGVRTYDVGVGRRKVRELKDLVDVAKAAAERAADYLRGITPAAPGQWVEKGRHDFVTDADRTAERLIAETLTGAVAGSTVLGEELTPGAAPSGDVVWIVDPLDGTTNFLHGYPQYAVSIGALVRGALRVGVVSDVPRGLTYWGATGQGAWLGDTALKVSTLAEPKHALVGTGFPFKRLEGFERYLRQLGAVVRASSGVRRAGSAALDLVDVAAGRFDAFWEPSLAPWDVAAGVVLVREAGGVVTTLHGEEDVLRHGSVVAGNPAMHGWLLDTLRGA